MKNLLLILVMVIATNATAVTITETTSARVDAQFVNLGGSNVDLGTGLEWLSFSSLITGIQTNFTFGRSIDNAAIAYASQGFRVATYTEVYNLFDFFYPTFVGDTNGKMSIDDLADPSAAIVQERNSWLTSFGTFIDDEGDLHSRGLYLDEEGDAQLMGAILNTNPLSSYLYGTEYNLSGYDSSSAFRNAGVFMVRDFAPVPAPAAVWLLGSGLIALAAFARRRNKI